MKQKLFHLQKMVTIALLAMVAIGTYGCSKEDKENDPEDTSLAGTSWTILSDIDDITGDADEDVVGVVITFQKDGNLKFSQSTEWTYSKWSQNGTTLRITLGEEGYPDDYMEGTISFHGNKATFKYAWYDCEGEWGNEEHGTTTLQKK